MNSENGMPQCWNCHTDCDDEDLTLVDSMETDIDTGVPYPIQIAICPDCLAKKTAEELPFTLGDLLSVIREETGEAEPSLAAIIGRGFDNEDDSAIII